MGTPYLDLPVAVWNFCTKVPKPFFCVWMLRVVGYLEPGDSGFALSVTLGLVGEPRPDESWFL